jgi:hypothetical protein
MAFHLHGDAFARARDGALAREYRAWRWLSRHADAVPPDLRDTYVASYFASQKQIPPGSSYPDIWRNGAKLGTQAKSTAAFVALCDPVGMSELLRSIDLWPVG